MAFVRHLFERSRAPALFRRLWSAYWKAIVFVPSRLSGETFPPPRFPTRPELRHAWSEAVRLCGLAWAAHREALATLPPAIRHRDYRSVFALLIGLAVIDVLLVCGLVSIPLLFWLAWHAAALSASMSRSFAESLNDVDVRWGIPLIATTVLLLLIVPLWAFSSTAARDPRRFLLSFLGLSAFLLFMIVSGFVSRPDLDIPTQRLSYTAILTLGALSLGGLADYFKQFNKMWYGVSELVVSSASTWFLVSGVLGEQRASLQQWIALAASVYLFSRGVGNAVEGYEETRGRESAETTDAPAESRPASQSGQ